MTYITGRINGNYSKYKELLERISLKQSDELYVLGDIAGEEQDGIDIFIDMSMRSNVFSILGDCELELLKRLRAEDKNKLPAKFSELDEDFKLGILEYLSDMPLYDEIELDNRKYLLVHAGINNYHPERALEDYKINELIYECNIPDNCVYNIITAHGNVCGRHISLEREMPENTSIFALRLNDMAEFYI